MIATISIYIIVLMFILLRAYASLPKFFNMKRFGEMLKTQAIPKWVAAILKWILPVVEVLTLYLLIMPETRLLGLYISFLMMLVFTLYVGGIMFPVYDVYPCPCGALFRRDGLEETL